MDDEKIIVSYGFKIRPREWASGTGYQVDFGTVKGKRIRKQFPTLQKAKAEAHKERLKRDREGLSGLKLSDSQRIDAMKAIEILEGTGISLSEAATRLAAEKKINSILIEDLVSKFLNWMEKTPRKLRSRSPGGYRSESIKDSSKKLSLFSEWFKGSEARSLKPDDIIKWFDEEGYGDSYRDNIRRQVAMLYSWGTSVGPLQGMLNPFAGMRSTKPAGAIPKVMTPAQVKKYMSALESEQAAFALMFFAGIRPDEVLRLSPDDVGSLEIHISAEVSKTHYPRLVSVNSNLRAWLKKYPFTGALAKDIRKAREEACKASGIKWVMDYPRHCFATYFAALHGMDRTAEELGHQSTGMLHKHYRGLVRNRKKAAESYFKILPK